MSILALWRFHNPSLVLEYLGELFGTLMSAFGTLVLTFYILQRFNVRPELDEEEWDPRSLPPIEDSDTIKRPETVIGLAFALVILVILWFFPDIIGVVVGWGQDIIVNPVIEFYRLLISVVLLLGIGLDLVLLRQGRWTPSYAGGQDRYQPVQHLCALSPGRRSQCMVGNERRGWFFRLH